MQSAVCEMNGSEKFTVHIAYMEYRSDIATSEPEEGKHLRHRRSA